jgi:hypothetical protein
MAARKGEEDDDARFAVNKWLDGATGNDARGLVEWMAREHGSETLQDLLGFLVDRDPREADALRKMVKDEQRRLERLEREEILREACRRSDFDLYLPLHLPVWEERSEAIGRTGTEEHTAHVRVTTELGTCIVDMRVDAVIDSTNGKARSYTLSYESPGFSGRKERLQFIHLAWVLYQMLSVSRFLGLRKDAFEHVQTFKRFVLKDGRQTLVPVHPRGREADDPEYQRARERNRDRSRSRERK